MSRGEVRIVMGLESSFKKNKLKLLWILTIEVYAEDTQIFDGFLVG